jgi:hypothetical protein
VTQGLARRGRAWENKFMAYSSNTLAEDVLQTTRLGLDLPSIALELEGVRKILGISEKQAQEALAARSRKYHGSGLPKEGISRIELGRVEWEWEWDTDTRVSYDEDGREEREEIRTGYGIDGQEVGALSTVQYKLAQVLRVLGIPSDLELFNGIDAQTDMERGRLSTNNHGDYCQSMPLPDPIDANAILEMAKKCSDLSSFTQWLSEEVDQCPALAEQVEPFELFMAHDGRARFIDASAHLLSACSAPSRRWGQDIQIKWDEKLSEWIRTTWNGEDPLARFARCSLPIALPKLEELMDLAMKRPEPDEVFIAAVLSAYCVANARPIGSPRDHKASLRSVLAASKCLGAHPNLAQSMAPAAKAFFDLDMAKPDARMSEVDMAQAEACWLKAQSLIARSDASLSPGPRRQAL